jgi:selenide, water dikinase
VQQLNIEKNPNILAGIQGSDDAGVFKLNEKTALVQTLDFFTPIVDSPYEFGMIAAANALSDVYAMGGVPLTAMNIVCFPEKDMSYSILKETLEGGLSKIHEAGAALVGGHSINDNEFKYGLSVTGIVHPEKYLANCNANIKDKLILTKPIGTGILATALKAKILDEKSTNTLISICSELNKKASEIMLKYKPSACTDITGFGLAGHILEMAKAGRKKITIFTEKIPFIETAKELALMGIIPAGAYANRDFCQKNIFISSSVERVIKDLIFDPQTSGGLLISINEKNADTCLLEMLDNGINAALIGEVSEDNEDGFLSVEP